MDPKLADPTLFAMTYRKRQQTMLVLTLAESERKQSLSGTEYCTVSQLQVYPCVSRGGLQAAPVPAQEYFQVQLSPSATAQDCSAWLMFLLPVSLFCALTC